MSPDQLRAFQPFTHAEPRLLGWAAQRSSLLCLPEKRWLVRPGRGLPGCFYLLRGRLRLVPAVGGDQAVTAHDSRARWPVYPGAVAVQTRSPVQLLRLDLNPRELETVATPGSGHPGLGIPEPGCAPVAVGLPEVDSGGTGWEHAFLASPLMQRLTPDGWQRVLRAMVRIYCRAGETVLRQGTPGDVCCVLAAGRAEVRRGRQVLAQLCPGDFFGEDALITGARRNASVVMLRDGDVRCLPVEAFQRLLLARVVRSACDPGSRIRLDIGARRPSGVPWLPLQRLRELAGGLDSRSEYAIQGGLAAERALAVFLLAQRGVEAVPLNS